MKGIPIVTYYRAPQSVPNELQRFIAIAQRCAEGQAYCLETKMHIQQRSLELLTSGSHILSLHTLEQSKDNCLALKQSFLSNRNVYSKLTIQKLHPRPIMPFLHRMETLLQMMMTLPPPSDVNNNFWSSELQDSDFNLV